nr:ribonuclease H-like domain-containing protein [Tanacetum cinerariifolium]
LQSTNVSSNGLNDGSHNGLRIRHMTLNLDNRRLDIFGASVISRMHRVLCHLGLAFHYFRKRRRGSRNRLICSSTSSGDTLQILLRSQIAVEESGVDELELGNPGLISWRPKWSWEVMGMSEDDYPVDFYGTCCGKRGVKSKSSEEVGVLQNVYRNLVDLIALRPFNIQIAVSFSYRHPSDVRQDLIISTSIEFPLAEEVSTASEEDSYEVPASTVSATITDTTSGETSKKSRRTVTVTAEDMQKKKNDVKARTTLLLSLLDEHQLAIQSDLDTMSLDDLYNHLKVYEFEVQKKLEPNYKNMAFISSAKHSSRNEDGNTACVPTASTNVPTASASIATISQYTAYAYTASQSSGTQIKFEDINQIDEDDMEEMDIKWNMAAGFDKSKVECFNCHKMSHFARECRAPRSQDRGRRDTYKQGSKAEEQAPKALMAIDGMGWDWSYMANDGEDYALVADEEAPTEFALMANTSTESKKLKILKKENEGVDGKLAGFLTASKDLDNLIESQRADRNKDGLGYSVVPPPPAQIHSSLKKDLSWTGLLEFANDTVTDYSRPSPTMESTSGDDQNRNPSVSETEASPSAITPKPFIKFVKANDSPTESKIDKAKKSPIKYVEQYRKTNKKPNVRGNQRNWNNLKSHQLGPDFVMKKKACFNCGEFNHLAYDCRKRVKNGTSRYQDDTHKSFTPRPVKSQYKAPWVPTVNRNFPPVNRKFSTGSRNFPTVNRKFPTANRKFPTGGINFHIADMGKKENAIKPSACWFWKPSQNLSNKGPNNNSGSSQNNVDDKGYWDSGCSRHMTCNISYVSDYEPFDRGYVSFGQGGCNITGKRTIKTGKLEFENMYFVKDLKYNLFSVSQICDNKNSVLFTDSECIVLRRDFKLLDDANILLRTLRKHNMYSIDLNNIVPHRDLTCLVAKASADECMLWHKRL